MCWCPQINFHQDIYVRTINTFAALEPKKDDKLSPPPPPPDLLTWRETIAGIIRNDIPLTSVEFALVVIVEFVTFLSPLLRLDFAQGDVQTINTIPITMSLGSSRIIWLCYVLWRQRKKWSVIVKDIFIFDNLMTRQLNIIGGYIAMSFEGGSEMFAAWTIPDIIMNAVWIFLLMAHFRVMFTYFKYTPAQLTIHQLVRMAAPLCFLIAIGTLTLENRVNQYAAFLLYSVQAFHGFFDVYARASLVTIAAAVKATEKKEQRNTHGKGKSTSSSFFLSLFVSDEKPHLMQAERVTTDANDLKNLEATFVEAEHSKDEDY